MDCTPTLNDWIEAHRVLLHEETTLISVAADVAARRADVVALQNQQARLVKTREHADNIYAHVMESLRRPG